MFHEDKAVGMLTEIIALEYGITRAKAQQIRVSELPYYIEMVAIADTFTALVCERPYKTSWPPEEALAYIQSQARHSF